jgi:large subunit ribosomal protein L16
MLSPKRTKFRKQMRRWKNRDATRCNTIAFGDFGLMSLETKWVSNRQIEAARIAMTRHIKRGGKVWIRLFPDKPYTKKPAETRMGKGKGNPEYWVATVQRGMILFEIQGVTKELAASAIRLAGNKLPIRTKFVMRRGAEQANA